MAKIEVSDKTLAEFERLLEELHTLYPQQKLSNDHIMEAMIGGFFDSLVYMKQQAEGHHWHTHTHWSDECCGEDHKCEDGKDCEKKKK